MNSKPSSNIDSREENSIDFKSLLYTIISHWKLFVITIIIGLSIAKFKNGYEEKSYTIHTTINIKEEHNPLFSSSTNIAFNWGGTSNNVEAIKANFISRTHNEKVVTKLKYYIEYLEEGKYRLEDVYGRIPFEIITNTSDYQLANHLIEIQCIDNNKVRVKVDFATIESSKQLIEYDNQNQISYTPTHLIYEETFDISDTITTPFSKFTIEKKHNFKVSQKYFIRFKNINSIVAKYRNIYIKTFKTGTSLLDLSLSGPNKDRIIDYLNTSVEVLGNDQKQYKIAYAIKTKNYIDTLFSNEAKHLAELEIELSKFKDSTNLYNIESEGTRILEKITKIDDVLLLKNRDIDYIQTLRNYLLSYDQRTKDIPAPTIAEISEPTTVLNTQELITLVTLKNELEDAGVTANHPKMIDIQNRITSRKKIVIENLSSLKDKKRKDIAILNKRLSKLNQELKRIPKLEQELIKYSRNYQQTENNYTYLKQKSYEAGTAIAANVSDIKILDKAKDVGQGSSRPRTSFNYLVSIMLAILFPLMYIVIKQLLDDSINSVEEIEKLYSIPVLGVIGKNTSKSNLVLFDRPKSSVAESFRALRSNLKFLIPSSKENTFRENKTILFTSSVSGEGKTMVSINMATAFALSGKKTILVGLDLRKPKIYDDFKVDNKIGIVNYLINQKTIKEITHKTKIPNLDLIVSGPIPPNPSELILSDHTIKLFKELKSNYDYIIIDTPPVGLVSDALELLKYTDANIYIIRQGYSKKGMMKMIDNKYINGEVKNIGYILNDFSTTGKYAYEYGYGYGYSYHENEKLSFSDHLNKALNIFRKNS
ncbi:polysaccharide biosynthesis tyrosine autokinase [Flavicella sp.]|uniref:exopolysaccharide transport family protein n=1 Tax=Flavicella sp. TaxID=2957742 RepID=UPI00301774AA